VPCRRRRTHDADQSRRRNARRAGKRADRQRLACHARKVEAQRDLCRDRQERQGEQGLVARRTESNQAEDGGSIYEDRPLAAAARHSVEDERDGQIRHRHLRGGYAVRQTCGSAGALWRHGEVGRRQRSQEDSGLRQGSHRRRQDGHGYRLGGRCSDQLRSRQESGGGVEDRL
jgi:hypothetical protein